ncbi:GAF domain-containing protein [Pedobacter westerhofensis]|uniref:GAF domain-containing protein n=2 Tax=Pedobacter westerhofensis TaxID=425512 RepID=A0A521CYN1_9SPHI|nr:GAF domain-containing protein [Pedobacter westerhofensis]
MAKFNNITHGLHRCSVNSLILTFNFIYRILLISLPMAEDLVIIKSESKEQQYQSLLPQIEALISGEEDLTANLANIAAALKEQFGWLWIGFYLVKQDELVLGPFQGPVACTRIRKGKGVCGAAWLEAKTFIVDDVEEFPGHIACSSASRSEIVLPLFKDGEVVGVLDADSADLAHFDTTDDEYLSKIIAYINL